MIKWRAVILFVVIFGTAILILSYSGIRSSRNNMLKLLDQEGRSLMEALITNAQNNVAASAIVEEATNERLVDVAHLLARTISLDRHYTDSLGSLQRRYRLEKIDLIDKNKVIVRSSWSETVGSGIEDDEGGLVVVDSVLSGKRDLSASLPLPSALPADELASVAVRTTAGVLLFRARSRKLTDYQASLGIGYVARQLGSQEGVDYVVLQSDSGIVLASRAIGPMVAVDADTFLTEALSHELIVSRIHQFEGREVLEIVRSFKSDALPSGLFRLGLSLDTFHQLYNDSLKQLAIISLVLFALGLVGSYAAVSSRKLRRTTSSLERLKSVTDEIIEAVEAAVVATGPRGNIAIFNPQAEQLFSLSSAAAVGKPYHEVFPQDQLFLDKIKSGSGQVVRGEIRYDQPQGETRHLLLSSSPIHTSAGKYSGAVALAYDLTELKRLEETARRSERLSELGNLAAGVAHEIRNPLNAISIASQRLRHEFKPADNEHEFDTLFKTISDEINRLNAIIKDFLALARGGEINKVLVDLRQYVDDIVSLVRHETQQLGIEITVDVHGELKVEIDPAEMRKVVLNLIKNGMEASPSGGWVRIAAAATDDNQVRIDVSNSGEAIPGEIREKIFQPYFTTKAEGTGLGLATSHRIVADHGGTLQLLDGEPITFRIVV